MKKRVNCWEFFKCDEKACPVYEVQDANCWLVPGTRCRKEIQGKILEKIETCLECEPFTANIDLNSMEETLTSVHRQFTEFKKMVEERDRELEGISLELAVSLSEVFEALQAISSGNPEVRMAETSTLELIAKLKHMVNLTAKGMGEIVDLSHEFAIGLAEHFDVLNQVSRGKLDSRVTGTSRVDLLESLKMVTNQMIESVSTEIKERRLAQDAVSDALNALVASDAQLRESEERYRILVDYGPNAIFVLELGTFKILNVNVRATKLYGYEKDELIGKSFMDLGPAKYADGVLSEAVPAPSSQSSIYPDIEHRRKDGTSFHVSVYVHRGRHSKKHGIIATTVDVTETVAKEQQLMQASKMSTIGEMAAGVAHEINNPIAVILGFTELLLEKFPEGSKEFEMLQTIQRQGDNCKKIVENLLVFARIPETGTIATDVIADLQKAVNLIMNTLLTRKVDLKTDMKEDLPKVRGDSHQLQQVFLNIMSNAVAAMPNGGILTISTHRSNDMVSITFTDTGHGIAPENMDKIFEPFFTTKKVGEGTGLGLSVSYGIVRKFGGEIQVKSQTAEDGKEPGTSFSVLLQVAERKNRESDADITGSDHG